MFWPWNAAKLTAKAKMNSAKHTQVSEDFGCCSREPGEEFLSDLGLTLILANMILSLWVLTCASHSLHPKTSCSAPRLHSCNGLSTNIYLVRMSQKSESSGQRKRILGVVYCGLCWRSSWSRGWRRWKVGREYGPNERKARAGSLTSHIGA